MSTEELRFLQRGTTLLRHRGPDDEGYVLIAAAGARCFRGDDSIPQYRDLPHIHAAVPDEANVGLGARRLSSIDLSASGHMPMGDADGNWLVFNGEIYNYRELREQLLGLGHSFHSESDTEVILRAYAQWGTACLERFNGMWAFALWDHLHNRLFCARDRFGEKQLYYHLTREGSVWFASEIAPLRVITNGNDPVNEPLVWDFLTYGLADHTAGTFFAGIEQLLPGTYFTFHPGEQLRVAQYYDLQSNRTEPPSNIFQAATLLRERLQDSVRLRLRSDVPVASFLSGGLDSSSIVTLANRTLLSLNGSSPYKVLRTYTNTYAEGHPYDESANVRSALDRWTAVDARFITASIENFKRDLLAMVACQEQPFHNVSIFASYNLLRLIGERDRIKVVLAGEAGDELLAGYQRVYLPVYLSRMLSSFQWGAWLREARAWDWRVAMKSSAKGFFSKLPRPLRSCLQRFRNPAVSLISPEFMEAYAERDDQLTDQWRSRTLNGRLLADITQFNLPQLLRHLDRNAMHWSVETRLPFLDHRLVEFVCSLPEEWKLHRGYSKYILREAMSADLPDSIVWKRSKLGFGMAEQFWLKECFDLLQPSAMLNQYVDVKELGRRLYQEGQQEQQSYWLPISLGLWLQTAYPTAP